MNFRLFGGFVMHNNELNTFKNYFKAIYIYNVVLYRKI